MARITQPGAVADSALSFMDEAAASAPDSGSEPEYLGAVADSPYSFMNESCADYADIPFMFALVDSANIAPSSIGAVADSQFSFVDESMADVSDSGDLTTAQLIAPSGKTTSDFGGGRMQDDVNPGYPVDIGLNQYREDEFCITATNDVASGDVYEFRLVRSSGQEYEHYTLLPRFTISAAAPIIVTMGTVDSVTTIAAPALTPGLSTVIPPTLSDQTSATAPITTPVLSLLAPTSSSQTSVASPVMVEGAASISGTISTTQSSAVAPTEISGSSSIVVPALSSSDSAVAPTVTSTVTLIVPNLSSTGLVIAPSLTMVVSVIVSAILSTTSVVASTISGGASSITGTSVLSTAVSVPPSLIEGASVIAVSATSSQTSIFPPDILYAGVVIPPALSSQSSVVSPIPLGVSTLSPVSLQSSNSVVPPILVPPNPNLQPSSLQSAASTATPTVVSSGSSNLMSFSVKVRPNNTDGFVIQPSSIDTTSNYIRGGRNLIFPHNKFCAWMRFDVDLPRGSEIVSAALRVWVDTNDFPEYEGAIVYGIRFRAFSEDDATDPISFNDFSSRVKTVAQTLADFETIFEEMLIEVDVKLQVQEVVSRSGFAERHLVLTIEDDGINANPDFDGDIPVYSAESLFPPELVIQYQSVVRSQSSIAPPVLHSEFVNGMSIISVGVTVTAPVLIPGPVFIKVGFTYFYLEDGTILLDESGDPVLVEESGAEGSPISNTFAIAPPITIGSGLFITVTGPKLVSTVATLGVSGISFLNVSEMGVISVEEVSP